MTLQHATAGQAPRYRYLYRDAPGKAGGSLLPRATRGSAGAERASPPRGAATSFSDGRGRVRACPPPFLLFPRLPDLTRTAACLTRAVQPPPRARHCKRRVTAARGAGGKGPACPPPLPSSPRCGKAQPARTAPPQGGMLHRGRCGMESSAPRRLYSEG